jgi:hypothetical protein
LEYRKVDTRYRAFILCATNSSGYVSKMRAMNEKDDPNTNMCAQSSAYRQSNRKNSETYEKAMPSLACDTALHRKQMRLRVAAMTETRVS